MPIQKLELGAEGYLTEVLSPDEMLEKLAELTGYKKSKLMKKLIEGSLNNILGQASHSAICEGDGFTDMPITDKHLESATQSFIDG